MTRRVECIRYKQRLLFFFVFTTCIPSAVTTTNPSATTAVIDLTRKTFNEELEKEKYQDSHLLIEFYAHWCPHCRHYASTYEEIAHFFTDEPRLQPEIWVARIDCADNENRDMCSQFKVTAYPTFYLGTRTAFLDRKYDQLVETGPKKPAAFVEFINEKLKTAYVFTEAAKPVAVEVPEIKRHESAMQFGYDDVERATVELFDRVVDVCKMLPSNELREALIDWISLMSEAHPSIRCRRGSKFLKSRLHQFWPESEAKPKPVFSRLRICTIAYKQKPWKQCAGSIPGKRGYTCGLWQLLHALSVNVAEDKAQLWVKGVRAFNSYFFGCAACVEHFKKELSQDDIDQMESREDLILWLWAAHNRVNKRISQEETKSGEGDPEFPKVQWPMVALCPDCSSPSSAESIDWDESQVLDFLRRYYARDSESEIPAAFSRTRLSTHAAYELTFADVLDQPYAAQIDPQSRGMGWKIWLLFGALLLVFLYLRRHQNPKRALRSKHIL